MNRNYNEYLTNGTSALKVARRGEERPAVRVICTPGAKRNDQRNANFVSENTVGYRQHAAESLNFIYDSIEQGTVRGRSLSFFSTSQIALMSIASVAISLAAIIL